MNEHTELYLKDLKSRRDRIVNSKANLALSSHPEHQLASRIIGLIVQNIDDLMNVGDQYITTNLSAIIINEYNNYVNILENMRLYSVKSNDKINVKDLYLASNELLSKMRLFSDVLSPNLIENNRLKSSQMAEEISKLLENSKRAATDIGVEKNQDYFAKEAKRNGWWAGSYTIFGIALGGFGVWAAIEMVKWWSTNITMINSSFYIAHTIAIRVFVLALISYLFVWVLRKANAYSHNQVVNRHRQNALNTYRVFIAGADVEEKKIILLRAAETIYSPQVSGFSSKESKQTGSDDLLAPLRNILGGVLGKPE